MITLLNVSESGAVLVRITKNGKSVVRSLVGDAASKVLAIFGA